MYNVQKKSSLEDKIQQIYTNCNKHSETIQGYMTRAGIKVFLKSANHSSNCDCIIPSNYCNTTMGKKRGYNVTDETISKI